MNENYMNKELWNVPERMPQKKIVKVTKKIHLPTIQIICG